MSELNRILRDAASRAAQLERAHRKTAPLPEEGQGINIEVFDSRTGKTFDVIVRRRRE